MFTMESGVKAMPYTHIHEVLYSNLDIDFLLVALKAMKV
jgi:hypothetical protein